MWNIQIEFTYFTHTFLKGEIDTWEQFLSFIIYSMRISYNDPKKFHTQCRLTNMLAMQRLTSKELLALLWDSSLWPGFLSFPLKKPKLSIPLFCRYFHFRSQYLFELNLQGNSCSIPCRQRVAFIAFQGGSVPLLTRSAPRHTVSCPWTCLPSPL